MRGFFLLGKRGGGNLTLCVCDGACMAQADTDTECSLTLWLARRTVPRVMPLPLEWFRKRLHESILQWRVLPRGGARKGKKKLERAHHFFRRRLFRLIAERALGRRVRGSMVGLRYLLAFRAQV